MIRDENLHGYFFLLIELCWDLQSISKCIVARHESILLKVVTENEFISSVIFDLSNLFERSLDFWAHCGSLSEQISQAKIPLNHDFGEDGSCVLDFGTIHQFRISAVAK